MKKSDALLAAAFKRTTNTIRKHLTYNLTMIGSVRLVLDFDELGAVWLAGFIYKNRRRPAKQTFYGPIARTPAGALAALSALPERALAEMLHAAPVIVESE